jgi:hypothetical protein
MRINDLYQDLKEEKSHNIPLGTRYTLPRTVIFPDMDLYYEYYKFVTAMASHPKLEDHATMLNKPLRDVPMAVAYSDAEFDMIMDVAKRMGKKAEEIAFDGSKEPPGANTTSPVMKFNMFESASEQMRKIIGDLT